MTPDLPIVLLAGGMGRRMGLNGEEKPLLSVGGVPLILRVHSALRIGLPSGRLYVATSPFTPRTEAFAIRQGWEVLRTPGKGYATDVAWLALRFDRFVTVGSDLPFLRQETVEPFLAEGIRGGNRVGLLPERRALLGGSPPELWPEPLPEVGPCRIVGVNIVEGATPAPSRPFLFDDPWIGVNVNGPEDLRLAERLCPILATSSRELA